MAPGRTNLSPRATSHQQVEGMGQHRLAGSGLTRDRVQASTKTQLGTLDHEQVLDAQFEQHQLVPRLFMRERF